MQCRRSFGLLLTNLSHYLQLRNAILSRVGEDQQEVDMLTWMGRTALELMGQAGLGYSFDPLERDSTDPYGHALKNLTYVHSAVVFFPVY